MNGEFRKRAIRVSVQLRKAGREVSKIIQGLPCLVTVTKPGLPDRNSASLTIGGLSLESMAELTTLSFQPLRSGNHALTVEAGEENGTLSVVFQGEIARAHADFNSAPDPVMRIEAVSGQYAKQMASPTLSVQGSVSAADLVGRLAAQMGYSFQVIGVTTAVRDAVFVGSPLEKAEAVARQVGAELILDDGVLLLADPDQARNETALPVSRNTGMIGYPAFTQDGITVRTLYSPGLQYGRLVEVESIVPHANGVWKITRLSHSLGAHGPDGGPWESSFDASPAVHS